MANLKGMGGRAPFLGHALSGLGVHHVLQLQQLLMEMTGEKEEDQVRVWVCVFHAHRWSNT
jgi:hypothetical protein